MTLTTFNKEIEEAIPRLLGMARELTYNSISDNCKFILTEIEDLDGNLYVQNQLRKKENDKKTPVPITELLPELKKLYHNYYDINLKIYRARKNLTIIDFQYYPKSSLDPDFQLKMLDKPPMIHCKVAYPPWLSDKKEKFDINWEHFEGLNRLRLILLKLKLKTRAR